MSYALLTLSIEILPHLHMCATTKAYVCHDSFMCASWLMFTNKNTHFKKVVSIMKRASYAIQRAPHLIKKTHQKKLTKKNSYPSGEASGVTTRIQKSRTVAILFRCKSWDEGKHIKRVVYIMERALCTHIEKKKIHYGKGPAYAKEGLLLWKEPNIRYKEPNIAWKEPYILYYAKSPVYDEEGRFIIKRAVYTMKNALNTRKRRWKEPYTMKRALYDEKSPIYPWDKKTYKSLFPIRIYDGKALNLIKKALYITGKALSTIQKTCLMWKEPYRRWKEPYMRWKEPEISLGKKNIL